MNAQQLIDSTPTAIYEVYGRRKALTKMFYPKGLPKFEDEDSFEKIYKEWRKLRRERLNESKS